MKTLLIFGALTAGIFLTGCVDDGPPVHRRVYRDRTYYGNDRGYYDRGYRNDGYYNDGPPGPAVRVRIN